MSSLSSMSAVPAKRKNPYVNTVDVVKRFKQSKDFYDRVFSLILECLFRNKVSLRAPTAEGVYNAVEPMLYGLNRARTQNCYFISKKTDDFVDDTAATTPLCDYSFVTDTTNSMLNVRNIALQNLAKQHCFYFDTACFYARFLNTLQRAEPTRRLRTPELQTMLSKINSIDEQMQGLWPRLQQMYEGQHIILHRRYNTSVQPIPPTYQQIQFLSLFS